VLEYLRTATPRFHIDGRYVVLDYSSSYDDTRRLQSAASRNFSSYSASTFNVAEAAHSSRGKKVNDEMLTRISNRCFSV